MFTIAPWYNHYQAPLVLMIDDLSDAYIDLYPETYKNDWGYLGNNEGSIYRFLESELLSHYPNIKITFFVPYLRHGVINEACGVTIQKYSLGERNEYTTFLQSLIAKGYEIAHHGSDHGRYLHPENCDVNENWIHEWALFETIEEGVRITSKGKEQFLKEIGFQIAGGKYCGYIAIENSTEIIRQCGFLYWCDRVNYLGDDLDISLLKSDELISFPTNVAGNSFVRLSYLTGQLKRDRIKRFTKYLQPLYNLSVYWRLHRLYREGKIISIQEHISPSTTWGNVQSSNIISDIKSLKRIFKFFASRNIWYATCEEIAIYHYAKIHSTLRWDDESLIIDCRFKRPLKAQLSICHPYPFSLEDKDSTLYTSIFNNGSYIVTLPVFHGKNCFTYQVIV